MSGQPITLSPTELGNIGEWMAALFRSLGLKDDEIDHAISETLTPAWLAVDRHGP